MTNPVQTNAERAAAAMRTNRRHADEAEFHVSSRSLHVQLFAAVPVTLALGWIVAWIGFAVALQLATLGGLVFIGYCFWKGEQVSIKSVILFVLGVIGVYLATAILGNRLVAAGILAVVTFIVFERQGRNPLDFFREYLFADSVFTNDQRQALPTELIRPSRVTLLVFLAVIVFVPRLHSTTFAILLICVLCPAILFAHLTKNGSPVEPFRVAVRTARFILSEYLTYPDAPSPARSWVAPEACQARRKTFIFLWASLAVTLMIGLSYCIPWELFASYSHPGFRWSVPPENPSGYGWLIAPVATAVSASAEYRWALGIGAVLSFVLPYAMLFTLYLPGIQRSIETMLAVEELRRLDPRTEYERRVDRTLDSEVLEA